MTTDEFLCLCDGNKKIWCAENCCGATEEPFVQLRKNGCLTAYSDGFIGRRKMWSSDPDDYSPDNSEDIVQDNKKLFRKPTRRLQLMDDGNIAILDHENPNMIIWKANLDSYKPYIRPSPSPTKSHSPSAKPTKLPTPTPTTSRHPSSSPTKSPAPTFISTLMPSTFASFEPGELIDIPTLGMRVSKGLSVRFIGETGSRVRFEDGTFSSIPVHDQPDAGGCFDQPNGGWIYVSNSEVEEGGGVGAFKFSPEGDILNYKMVQTGTRMNCGGGKSPWGTWFSGEEYPEGGMWEVDVRGKGSRMTKFGRGKFESATCDDRDMSELACFATLDAEEESLRRYKPRPQVLQNAISSGDFSDVMHSFGGFLSFLILDVDAGTYAWTIDKDEADKNAKKFYPNLEGIDHHDGKLYFVSKMKKQLYVLDLDSNTVEISSTISGAFNNQPDQIDHIIGDDPNSNGYLYFVEDGGKEPGIFAHNLKEEKAFTVLEKMQDEFDGDEATGLAFCDNFRRMIFAFQERGAIYEVTRDDGRPFYGATANVKYHQSADDRSRFTSHQRYSDSEDRQRTKFQN